MEILNPPGGVAVLIPIDDVRAGAWSHAHTAPSMRNAASRGEPRNRGFTLIELMIVVVIIAILSAIAIPVYQKYVRESRRASAKTVLLDLTSREERYFATNNVYTGQLTALGYANATSNSIAVPSAQQDFYNVTVAAAGTAATTYTATATPQGDQANDSCGSFSITDTGSQTATGGSNCW